MHIIYVIGHMDVIESTGRGKNRLKEKNVSNKRYALVGTGSRARMFIDALITTYRDTCELVALCDLSQVRMDWHNQRQHDLAGLPLLPTYHADDFDRMIKETHPDVVIVTTMDATHHLYIARAMELGCDVITEKPMTTDVEKMKTIFQAIERTGRSLRVSFNYRYTPAYTRFRELVMQGVVGKPLLVDFSWILDTSHGADYFRRWHREKQNSGGLLVHKATHHFDLVNWWIDSYPLQVFAQGNLLFYGQQNAAARGEHYTYKRYTGVPEAEYDPFALTLDKNEMFHDLYLAAEPETGYLRDRNVFGEPITIEDTMCVTARYRNGALLSYSLVAYSPWEGLRVSITGTKGRIEMDIAENINHLQGGGEQFKGTSKGPFKTARMRAYPMFGTPYEVDLPVIVEGGHGGADPFLLEQLFASNPPSDPFKRAASHIDGAASALVGIASNQSMLTGQMVAINDLFPLPEKATV
jgi:predicted dehydrogenase